MKGLVVGSVVVIIAATGLAVWWSRSSDELIEPSTPAPAVVLAAAPVAALPPSPPQPTRALEVPAAPQPVEPAVAPPAPIPHEVILATATKQANAKFDAVREQLVQRCWIDSRAVESGGQAGVELQITFDATGTEIARGGSEQRGSVPGVANCMRETEAGSLRIDPPGQTVTVTVKLTLP